MRILVVEDNKVGGKVMVKMLSEYGDCDIADNGEIAIKMYTEALKSKAPYKLVTLDIMMPLKDGHETLNEIRGIENDDGISGLSGAKVIMTTALSDKKNILQAFREQCEAYITKPVNKTKLEEELKKFGFGKKTIPKS